MKEIIQLQIGQCGNQIGNNFWKTISDEHGVNSLGQVYGSSDVQLDRINVYYREMPSKTYVPRAILMDLEPGTLDSVGGGCCKSMFRQENFICGATGAGNNWVKGYQAGGIEMFNRILNTIRLEAENCDTLQGIQMVHSLGGGTGSGLGSRLMQGIRQLYPKQLVCTFSVAPSPKVSDTIVEPYNALLAIDRLIQDAHIVHLMDNSALYDSCVGPLNLPTPTYGDLNHLVSQTMSGVTTGFRFAGLRRQQQVNDDMKTLTTNLVPFPELHFFTSGLAPLTYRTQTVLAGFPPCGVRDIVARLADIKNLSVSYNESRYLTAAVVFRGDRELCSDEIAKHVRCGNLAEFVDWIPENLKTAVYPGVPSHGLKTSGTIMANSTAVKGVFQRILAQYSLMINRRAFLHLYTEQGLEVSDFQQAEEHVQTLITDYLEYENMNHQETAKNSFHNNTKLIKPN